VELAGIPSDDDILDAAVVEGLDDLERIETSPFNQAPWSSSGNAERLIRPREFLASFITGIETARRRRTSKDRRRSAPIHHRTESR
jgi:hypothetical protein